MQEKYFKKNPPKMREREREREPFMCEKIMNKMKKRIINL